MLRKPETPQEEWRVSPSWPDYAVSSLGRIRREVTRSYVAVAGRMLTPSIAGQFKAYLGVKLWDHSIGKGKTVSMANLIAEAFIGPRPPSMEINHIDGVKTNNAASNLEYVTKRQQEDHAVRLGLHPKGVAHGSAKLDEATVREIKRALAAGERIVDIAARLVIPKGRIQSIKLSKTWRHIK